MGSGAASIALSLWVYEQSGRATDLALVFAAKFAVGIFFAPLAGAVIDHFRRRNVILWCDFLLALIAFAVAGKIEADLLWMPVMLVLVALSGMLDSTVTVALAASVRSIRNEADLTRANGVISMLDNVPAVTAPALGAALYASVGAGAAFVLDGVSFLLAALLVGLCSWTDHEIRPQNHRLRPFAGAAEGLTFIWQRPDYRALQLNFAALNLFNGIGIGVLTAYLLAASRESPAVLAAVNSAAAAGGLGGGILILIVGSRFGRRATIVAGTLMTGVAGRVAIGLTSLPTVWVVGAAVRGIGLSLTNAPLTAIWQERIPAKLQGHVFGARRLLGQGPVPIAVLVGGLLADGLFAPDSPVVSLVGEVWSRAASPGGGLAVLLILLGLAETGAAIVLLRMRALTRLASAP